MFAQWHMLFRKDAKSSRVLGFNAFSVPSGLWNHITMVFLLFSELKRNKSHSTEIVYFFSNYFFCLGQGELVPPPCLFCCSLPSPFWGVFWPCDNTAILDSLIPIPCVLWTSIFFFRFARCLNSSAPKSVTHDLIKLHLITQGCPSGLTPSFPEEFSPDLLNSSQALSRRPPGTVPCACWVTGIYLRFK